MFSFKPIYFVICALILFKSEAKISDKRLCVDVNCSELISVGKTLLRYASPEENVLSFAPNEDVKVYSHGAGDRPELVGVEIKGKRGYINKNHLRETNLLKRPKLLVDTEIVNKKPEVPLGGAETEIKADPTRQPFEIVDGTRIPLDAASFSTEAPAVNIVSSQSSEETTKPLDSVPEKQDVNPTVLKEPLLVNTEGNKTLEEQSQEQNNLDTKEDEPSDEEDDSDDEDDADADDNDSEKEKQLENNDSKVLNDNVAKNVNENILSSGNSSAENVVNSENTGTINNVTSEDFILEVKTNENVSLSDNVDASNIDSTVNIPGNIPLSEQPGIINSNGAEDKDPTLKAENNNKIENIGVELNQKDESSNNIVDKIEIEQITIEKSLNMVNDMQKEEIDKDASNKNSENNAEATEKSIVDETKEAISSDESHSLPGLSTESPIEIEAMPPVYIDSVTPNPVHNNEDTKNDTEDYSNPSDLTSTFKDPVEGGDSKVEEKTGESLFGGLGGIFPMFNNGADREISEETKTPIITDDQVVEENEKPIGSEEGDVAVPAEQQIQNSEGSVQTEEVVVSESDPVTTSQNSNSETSEENKLEETSSVSIEKPSDHQEESSGGLFSKFTSFFGGNEDDGLTKIDAEYQDVVKESYSSPSNTVPEEEPQELNKNENVNTNTYDSWSSNNPAMESVEINNGFCSKGGENCPNREMEEVVKPYEEKATKNINIGAEDLQILFVEAFSSDLFLYLTTTALSVIFLVFGMVILDKCRREGPLISRINKLEQQLLTTMKENEMLQEKSIAVVEEQTQLVVETVPNEVVEELNQKLAEMSQIKLALEEQIQALEKELDTSTEVGIELNKILSEMLNSSDGSDIIKENIEQMQKKLLEQQDTINTINETLSFKETENHELRLDMEINNRKVIDLQSELDRMVEKILKIEEERDQQHSILENEIIVYKTKCKEALSKEHDLTSEIQVLKQQLLKVQRVADVKVKEYTTLKESLNAIKSVKNNKDALKSLLEVSEIKAQMEQLKSENLKYSEQLSQEREANVIYGTKMEGLTQEVEELREKYDKADKEKVEINTKLQVLNNYFKEKEEQMQKEISKYELLWVAKEGEATSTTERIRYMQEELQNYKAQNESLKQEIVNQEVELKSQISMLEKKAHESWVANRQTERKLEEARQEAAQLRNRLTLRERAIAEGNNQARIQSPLHQNGELPISPPPIIDPTQSPPPFFNPREHLAKSPPIPGMPPPPFLPPRLGGAPFIPPPPLDGSMPPLGDMGGMPPPFMPPLPPGMFPGDHRPPPLGRMSSPPPVGGRYTPESTAYSDYDRYSRRSPSPPYDSEYGASPPPIRGYSPYQDRSRDDRREYKRPQARSNGRNSKGIHSSGSENDSLGKINKKPQRKV